MKYQYRKILLATLLFLSFALQAQDKNNPWVVSFGANVVDTRTSAGGGKNWFDSHFSQFFDAKNNWNVFPSVTYVGVGRHIKGGLSFGLNGSYNSMTKAVYYRPENENADSRGMIVSNPGDLRMLMFDGNFKYSFQSLLGSKILDPFLTIGGGYTLLGDYNYFTFNPGAGAIIWFGKSKDVGVNLSTSYKKSFGDREDVFGAIAQPSYFNHQLGLVFKLKGHDKDKDGVADKKDACPDVFGLKKFNGCPDSDEDGIADNLDNCPDKAGKPELMGCPESDSDNDGVLDKEDECPTLAGEKQYNGCPDTDKDGVSDNKDACPTEAGIQSLGGCPDTDGDGIADKDDKCPNEKGSLSNAGCPDKSMTTAAVATMSDEDLKRIISEKRIYFTVKKTYLDSKFISELDEIRDLMVKNPTMKLEVRSYSDSRGTEEYNYELTARRSRSIIAWLVEHGIERKRLAGKGSGERELVNKCANGVKCTEEEHAENRRTQFIITSL